MTSSDEERLKEIKEQVEIIEKDEKQRLKPPGSIELDVLINLCIENIHFLLDLVERSEKQNENNANVVISVLDTKAKLQAKVQSLEAIREKGIAIKDYLDHNVKPSPIIDEGLSIFKLLFEFEQAIQELEKKEGGK